MSQGQKLPSQHGVSPRSCGYHMTIVSLDSARYYEKLWFVSNAFCPLYKYITWPQPSWDFMKASPLVSQAHLFFSERSWCLCNWILNVHILFLLICLKRQPPKETLWTLRGAFIFENKNLSNLQTLCVQRIKYMKIWPKLF